MYRPGFRFPALYPDVAYCVEERRAKSREPADVVENRAFDALASQRIVVEHDPEARVFAAGIVGNQPELLAVLTVGLPGELDGARRNEMRAQRRRRTLASNPGRQSLESGWGPARIQRT
jgi:hypothetical protein